MDEKQLMLLLSYEDHNAFREIMTRYYTRLFPFILSITKHYAASEEMLQDVFMRVWERRAEMPTVNALKPWLFRVASNFALNWLKRASIENRILQQLGVSQPPVSTITQERISYKEAVEEINTIVSGLPPQQRQIFQLTHNEGLTQEEIAQQLNISPHTVRSHLGKAIQSVRAALRSMKGMLWELFTLF